MAKTNHVIISYFANKDQAATAGDEIKEWDKANDAIKLGGVGVLTWKDGKIRTHKISRVRAGRGAKWGTVLGATAAILSGARRWWAARWWARRPVQWVRSCSTRASD